jgi:hypothetical protein
MITLKETLKNYKEELDNDVQLDRVNLEDKQLKLPGVKAKWVARLMNHKSDLQDLIDTREEVITQLIKKIKEEALIAINDILAHKEAERHELIKKVDKEINNQRCIIEYLEKVEKIVSSVTYDIKGAIDLIKLETT